MKLTQVQVCEYKCIRKTGPFNITDITCLVGKNEAGKTAILQALYRLNPIIEGNDKFDVDSEYPRIDVEDYRFAVDNKERRPAVVVKATFSISDDDLEDLNNHLGKKVLKEPILTLSKGYENELFVSLNVDEKIAIKTLVENYKLSSSLKRKVVQSSRLKELSQVLKEHPEDKSAKNLLDLVSQILDHGLITYIYTNYLKKRVPKFLYFDEYYQMEGHVNLQALKGRQQKKELRDSDRPLLGLVELSRLNLDEMINPLRTETMISKLEGASNHLVARH